MHRSSFADIWWSVNGGFELTVVRNLSTVEILVCWWREEICTSEDYGEALLQAMVAVLLQLGRGRFVWKKMEIENSGCGSDS